MGNEIHSSSEEDIKTRDFSRVLESLQSYDKPAVAERVAIANVMRTSRLPKGNARNSQWQAVSPLRNDETIVVLESDKGNATVVLDSDEYEREALDVKGRHPLKKILCDPTRRNEERES